MSGFTAALRVMITFTLGLQLKASSRNAPHYANEPVILFVLFGSSHFSAEVKMTI